MAADSGGVDRVALWIFPVALSVIIFGSMHAQGPFQHNGQVADADRKEGVYTQVTAYESDRQGGPPSECPTFAKQLASTNSDKASGNFVLRLGPTPPTYVNVYCASGFVPRVDRALQNLPNEPVIPKPVLLARRNTDAQAMTRIFRAEFRTFTSDLRYFQQVNAGALDTALLGEVGADISPEERQLLDSIRNFIASTRR